MKTALSMTYVEVQAAAKKWGSLGNVALGAHPFSVIIFAERIAVGFNTPTRALFFTLSALTTITLVGFLSFAENRRDHYSQMLKNYFTDAQKKLNKRRETILKLQVSTRLAIIAKRTIDPTF